MASAAIKHHFLDQPSTWRRAVVPVARVVRILRLEFNHEP